MIKSTTGSSASAGYRFPREVIVLAVRWYLRYGLSCRDVEELLAERGTRGRPRHRLPVGADLHVGVHRRCPGGTARHGRSLVRRRYLCEGRRPVDLSLSRGRSARAGHRRPGLRTSRQYRGAGVLRSRTEVRFCFGAGDHRPAPLYPRVIDELVPGARRVLERYANNVVEADHGRLRARLRPMRGVKTISSLRTIVAGHAFVQNLHRARSNLTADLPVQDRVRAAVTELAPAL